MDAVAGDTASCSTPACVREHTRLLPGDALRAVPATGESNREESCSACDSDVSFSAMLVITAGSEAGGGDGGRLDGDKRKSNMASVFGERALLASSTAERGVQGVGAGRVEGSNTESLSIIALVSGVRPSSVHTPLILVCIGVTVGLESLCLAAFATVLLCSDSSSQHSACMSAVSQSHLWVCL